MRMPPSRRPLIVFWSFTLLLIYADELTSLRLTHINAAVAAEYAQS